MTDSESNTTRRRFLQNSTATAAAVTLGLNAIGAPKARAARGANEKIRVGCIGVGNRGTQLLRSFLKQDDVQVAALCDVYEPYLMRDNSKVSKTLQDSLGGRIPTMTEDLGSDVARLARSGVSVRFDHSDAHMHHKFAVFDRRLLLTGSFNWTRSASSENHENIVLTSDARLVGAFSREFEALWEAFGRPPEGR